MRWRRCCWAPAAASSRPRRSGPRGAAGALAGWPGQLPAPPCGALPRRAQGPAAQPQRAHTGSHHFAQRRAPAPAPAPPLAQVGAAGPPAGQAACRPAHPRRPPGGAGGAGAAGAGGGLRLPQQRLRQPVLDGGLQRGRGEPAHAAHAGALPAGARLPRPQSHPGPPAPGATGLRWLQPLAGLQSP
jgi:hypothetical protein